MSTAGNTPPQLSKDSKSRAPFLAFTTDAASAVLFKEFATKNNLGDSVVYQGDIDAAAIHLKSNPSPKVLCVDINSAESAPAALDRLADVCDPDIKVIVSGKINEYSFYCWLVEVGITNYLLKPFTLATLETTFAKATEVKQVAGQTHAAEVKKDGKIISVVGTRGGVGATTVVVNLAWILANHFKQKTAILDFDPQLGTVALALDLEPGRGLREALEKPDRIDGLFMDRVMVRLDDQLSILSTEEGIEDNIVASQAAAEALIKQTRPKFSHVVIDVPRHLSPYTRHAMGNADYIICVTEYSIMGLREALRYLEYCRDILKKPAIFVGNRTGMAGKHQMPQAEFEKGLGQKIAYNIPFLLDAHAAATAGELLVETAKNSPATKALYALAGHFIDDPDIKDKESAGKAKGLFGFLKGGK